jgi:hypothetical protein
MPPILTYSLLALCAVVLILGFVIERRRADDPRFGKLRRFAWVLQVGAFVAAYFVIRPGEADGDPRQALSTASAAHAPVFIDVYSNF